MWDGRYGPALYLMGARHYSTQLGRFLQPDPIAAEANLYAYAANSPITKIDPSGTFWYKVKKGDTLLKLSERFFGDTKHVRTIVNLNKGVIAQRRGRLNVGQCIWIPPTSYMTWAWPANVNPCKPQKPMDIGPALNVAAKCSFAVWATGEWAAGAVTTGTLAAASVVTVNPLLAGAAGFSGMAVAYNTPYTAEVIQYCLGGKPPTSPSTMFLPTNFPPAIRP
ncbi:MAG: LysM peptidoglycan-binding domain-containing protein [Chloroflexota bacterium]|nr:MAG: LysM peptidoglycan-binding domain-containing protein [Chloroflexota bacterium]